MVVLAFLENMNTCQSCGKQTSYGKFCKECLMNPNAKQNQFEIGTSTSGRTIIALLWIIPIIGVVIGGFILLTGFATANSAPQEAVVAALACACAVLPYCFTRAITEIIEQMIRK